MILGAVLGALLAAWAAGRFVRTDPAPTNYHATTVMIHAYRTPAANDLPGQITSLSTIAALAKFDPVPQQVAARIGFEGDPLALAGRIQAFVDELGFLRIQALAPRARDAEILSRTFAEELNNAIEQRQVDAIDEVRGSLQQELSTTQTRLSALEESGITDGQRFLLLSDQRDELRSQLRTLAGAVPDTGLQVIQPPVAIPVRPNASAAPSSPTARYLIALVLGLLLGIGLALLLERLDTRIRSREEAGDSFELPVLAEVPMIPRSSRDTVVTANGATSVEAESFRLLAAEISRGAVGAAGQHAGEGPRPAAAPGPPRSRRVRSGRPSAILVTSGGPSEGKTTVAGNLAGTLAEAGNRVLVLSCDLRLPAIHRMFGVPNDVGLVDRLGSRADGDAILEGCVWKTPVPGVRLVPTGEIAHRAPGELLSSDDMVDLLTEARQSADIVLIDTSPILTTSDATYLLSIVDAVVVVARAGKTTKAVAARTSEILRRFKAPVAGVVLNGSSEIALPRDYRYYYYRDQTSGNGAGPGKAVREGDPAARSTDEVPT